MSKTSNPSERFLRRTPFGSAQYWVTDSDGNQYVKTQTNVGPILESNKNLYNQDDRGYSKSRELRRVATIPLPVFYDFLTRHGDPRDPDAIDKVCKKYLNDPDWRFLRTAPGRL